MENISKTYENLIEINKRLAFLENAKIEKMQELLEVNQAILDYEEKNPTLKSLAKIFVASVLFTSLLSLSLFFI